MNPTIKLKVFDTYPGGKGSDGVYQQLINLIPPHNVKICGYLGNCAIMRYLRPAPVNVGVDLDSAVISNWTSNLSFRDSQIEGPQFDLFTMNFFDYWIQYGKHFDEPDTFIFLDPPYPFAVRKSKTKIYNFEMSSEDHERLLKLVKYVRAKVMLCTYDDDDNINELYREHLKDWLKINYQGRTRRGVVTEAVYLNYTPAGELHDYNYIGKDNIDRQRIKRKIDRHVNRLKKLPPEERNAILNSFKNSFNLGL